MNGKGSPSSTKFSSSESLDAAMFLQSMFRTEREKKKSERESSVQNLNNKMVEYKIINDDKEP